MTTAQAWVDRCRQYVLGGQREQRNQLATNYTAGSGTLTLTYALGPVSAGARLSVGGNTFYVWDVNQSAKTVTVSAAEESSTDANANAGAVVRVNPILTGAEILQALNDELQALSSPSNGLYQAKVKDLTYSAVLTGYDLTGATDLMTVYEVRRQTPGPYKDWPRIPSVHWRLDRNDFTTDFPSALSLKIFEPSFNGYDVRLVYKAAFTTLADSTIDVATTGLAATAYDLPPIGAAIRLFAGREIKRNLIETQGDTRRGTEVPPGAVLNSIRGLQMLQQQRVEQEAARLNALYPAFRE